MHSNTDPEHRWPLTIPPESREHLAIVQNARRDATAAWKARNPGSKQGEIPHRDFLQLIGLKMDPTVFSRLMSEKGYPADTAPKFLAELHAAVRQWRMASAYAQRLPKRPVHDMPWFADMEGAAMDSAALEEQGIQERAVVLLAPTGGGKTTLARELKKRLGRAVIVSAHESWRDSYFAVLSSILQALGERVPHNARRAEAALLSHLTESKVTLIFDEQDFFGRSALNLIRQILNETRAAVVMHMLPQTWDRIVRDGGEYAAQFCRRCCVVTKAPALTEKEALPFLRESLPDAPEGDLREAAKVLAREANIFGSISLLSSVAESLSRIRPDAGQSLAQLAATVAKYYHTRRQLSLNIAAA